MSSIEGHGLFEVEYLKNGVR